LFQAMTTRLLGREVTAEQVEFESSVAL
jgi:hypothetical protein